MPEYERAGLEDPEIPTDWEFRCHEAECRVQELEAGIRHLGQQWKSGDDKCWKDIVELCQLLPEGFTVPENDTCVELQLCEQYIKSCHHPDVKYTSPQRRIEELELSLKNSAKIEKLTAAENFRYLDRIGELEAEIKALREVIRNQL